MEENVQCGRHLGSNRIRMRMTLFHPPKGMQYQLIVCLRCQEVLSTISTIQLPHADNELHTQYLYNQIISMIINKE